MFFTAIFRYGRELTQQLQASAAQTLTRAQTDAAQNTSVSASLTQGVPSLEEASVALRRLGELVGASQGSDLLWTTPPARVTQNFPLSDDGAQLARQFAPVFHLHPGEQFQPADPDAFIHNSTLREHRSFRPDAELQGQGEVTPLELGALADEDDNLFLDHPNDPLARRGDASSAPVMYQYDPAEREVTYWTFYSYNAKDYLGPVQQAHEGDWERVTISFDRQRRPERVRYSSHEGSTELAWRDAPKENGRPSVFVARGSHANSPVAENMEVEVDGPDVYVPNGARPVPVDILPDTVDEFARGGITLDARTRLEDVTAQDWYGTGVDWGSRGSFDFTSGPEGPSHDKDGL